MMGNDVGLGEQAERNHRRRFWRGLGIVGLFGALAGLTIGIGMGRDGGGIGDAIEALPSWLAVPLILTCLVGFTWGSARFMNVIDEVERDDNLWGSTAAYYAYAVALPTWWALWKAGVVAEPSDWAIYVGALVAGMAAYALRKWRAR